MEPGAIRVANPVIFGQILFWLVNAHATPMIKYFEYPPCSQKELPGNEGVSNDLGF